ncbi:MAG TPA: chemotaxis protein CheW [Burkholderiaceae bacterium]|nr:chemotaxis protein CheW [Burkholderiaceae bacterium]
MANKEALRELQTRLAERLKSVRAEVPGVSWLAVECAGRGFLLPLHEAGEIFAMTPIVPVAHARPWFLGVANLRGGLHGVVDLAAFLGIKGGDRPSEPARERVQLVAFNAALDVNCALLVDRLAGLRRATQMTPEADAPSARPDFVGDRYRDDTGRVWQELRLAELARHESFLRVVD